MNLMQPFVSEKLTLKNKLVYPPVRIKRATDGYANYFHLAHYMSFAVGQVGLIIMEECAVTADGRLGSGALGLYEDGHVTMLAQIVAMLQNEGSKVAIQLNHAGSKSRLESGNIIQDINALTAEDITALFDCYTHAAARADKAGFDALEIMASHEFLISQFIDRRTNQRSDKYADPVIFLTELLTAVRKSWPEDKAVILRIGTRYCEEDSISFTQKILRNINPFIDIVHISNGGSQMHGTNKGVAYQLEDTKGVKKGCEKPVIVVGGIRDHQLADEILEHQYADLIAVGRGLLRNPNWYLEYLLKYDRKLIPRPYIRAFR